MRLLIPFGLQVNSKLKQLDQVSPEDFKKWYEGVHIPDIFKSGGIKEALRWETINPDDERPYLALYPLEDLDFLQTPEFKGSLVVRLSRLQKLMPRRSHSRPP